MNAQSSPEKLIAEAPPDRLPELVGSYPSEVEPKTGGLARRSEVWIERVGSIAMNLVATGSESFRADINMPLAAGLRRRQIVRLFERWRKDRSCTHVLIQGKLLDTMPIEAVKDVNAFYTPDSWRKGDAVNRDLVYVIRESIEE